MPTQQTQPTARILRKAITQTYSAGMEQSPQLIQRYEMKYRISSDLVPAVRDAIRPFCIPDKAGVDGVYTISSLYLDGPRRRLYRETKQRVAHRFKLRVRRYHTGPFFLEVKGRSMDVVRKTRCAIEPKHWPDVLHDPASPGALVAAQNDSRGYQNFVNSCLTTMAQPSALVRYEREAWVSINDDYGRVTFDRHLVAAGPDGWRIAIDDDVDWYPTDAPRRFGFGQSGVVLELKCTTQPPLWMTDIVNRFGLRRSGFSKYANAVEVTQMGMNAPWSTTLGGD